ncbi:MAG: hypothetical protein IPK81_18305 [Rhodospirillales bacterium]|nr:MAG: hypothetical protein IPK81_18305 [Rhodospirillales bacterium]
MAKGQQRSNREAKKPKAKKPAAPAPGAPQPSFMTRGLAPAPGDGKKKR